MRITEYDIVQNVGINALILHKFVDSYYKEKQMISGPNIALSMIVLPIIHNQTFLNAISNRNLDGGFHNALTEFRDLPVGLQERMESMANQTFEGLNLAFSSRMLTYNKEMNELIPVKGSHKPKIVSGEIKKMISGAHRLGHWSSVISFEQLCINLKIRF